MCREPPIKKRIQKNLGWASAPLASSLDPPMLVHATDENLEEEKSGF